MMRRLPFLIVSLMWLIAAHAQAATFTVNNTADAVDATPGDGVCETAPGGGICTLRAAIQESNALPGADTIIVPAGTYTLSIPGQFCNTYWSDSAYGDLDITDNLTVTGAGAANTIIDGGRLDRVFHAVGSHTVQIAGVTIQNGNAEAGAGILNSSGTLTLCNVAVSGNTGTMYTGGIYTWRGTLTLTDVIVSGNMGMLVAAVSTTGTPPR